MAAEPSQLRIESMRVIWRDTFIVADAPRDFQARALDRLRRLPHYIADSTVEDYRQQPEFLRVVERVSRSVAPLGYADLSRIQFAGLRVANLRPVMDRYHRPPQSLTDPQVQRAVLACGRTFAAPQYGLHARHELARVEGFGQVVIGT